jgi:hypothetical protein
LALDSEIHPLVALVERLRSCASGADSADLKHQKFYQGLNKFETEKKEFKKFQLKLNFLFDCDLKRGKWESRTRR